MQRHLTPFPLVLSTAIATVAGSTVSAMLPTTAWANQPVTATVQSLTLGDRACYVELMDETGFVTVEFATFEVCDQGLVNQPVQITYALAPIMAASCQGAPDCAESDLVILITQIQPMDLSVMDPPTMATVQSLVAGDRGCYAELIDPTGYVSIQLASFEICDQALVNRPVQLTYEAMTVMAASCQGDPDCSQVDTVMLITDAQVIDVPAIAMVQSLVVGDRGCYVELMDEMGTVSSQLADYDICSQDLEGEWVSLTYTYASVLAIAASCESDFDCGENEGVMLITAAEVISPRR